MPRTSGLQAPIMELTGRLNLDYCGLMMWEANCDVV